MRDKIEEALSRKARGFYYRETVDEYARENGELTLVRRKISKKYAPPDVAALKYAQERRTDLSAVSDEELLALREKLIAERDGKEEK